jgi:hypothetical protein
MRVRGQTAQRQTPENEEHDGCEQQASPPASRNGGINSAILAWVKICGSAHVAGEGFGTQGFYSTEPKFGRIRLSPVVTSCILLQSS